MLVLTRKAGEAINIGDNVFIRVIQTRAGQVRIGIEAPRDVTVTREELLQRNQAVKAIGNCYTSAKKSVSLDNRYPEAVARRPR